MKRLLLLSFVALASTVFAHTDDTEVGRIPLVHPDLGHEGGAGLHTKVRNAWERLSDAINSRYNEYTGVNNSTLTTVTHNLGEPFANLAIALYTGTGTSKVRVTDPTGSGWVIAANGGNPTTQLDVTTPSSGQPHSFSVEIVGSVGVLADTDLHRADIDGGTATNSSRITVPKAGTAALNALTRKQATVVYDTDLSQLKVDDGTNLVPVGSGSGGSGEVNFIEQVSSDSATFEITAGAWVTFDDGAVSTPVDGIGGTAANLTFLRGAVAGSRLRGDGYGQLTKAAADAQGEGKSIDLDIDRADAGKVLKIDMQYRTSANYANGDLGLWVLCDVGGTPTFYDVRAGTDGTNHNLVYQTGGFPSILQATFTAPTNPDHLDCRMITMVRTTNASAWTVEVDDVVLGPGRLIQGGIVGSWTPITPTGNWTSGVTYSGMVRQVGESAEFIYTLAITGAIVPSATTLVANLPTGYTIDSTVDGSSRRLSNFGSLVLDDASGGITAEPHLGYVNGNTDTSVRFVVFNDNGTFERKAEITDTSPVALVSGDTIKARFTVPIVQFRGRGTMNALVQDNLKSWTTWTPSWSGVTLGTGSTNTARYRYVDDTLEVHFVLILGTGGSASGNIRMSAPAGFTWSQLSSTFKIGSGAVTDADTSANNALIAIEQRSDASQVGFRHGNNNQVGTSSPFTWAVNDTLSGHFWAQVNELQGTQPSLVGWAEAGDGYSGLVQADSTTVNISSLGAFSAAQPVLTLNRLGKQVTLIFPSLAHSSTSSPNAGAGFIPVGYRPASTMQNAYAVGSTGMRSIAVQSDGTLFFDYRDWAGVAESRTTTGSGSITWVIP